MKQQTLAMANGFERYTKKTRRTLFLEAMEQVVPWAELCALVEPVYAKAGNGRPPVGAERMLRIYFLQQWFNLSDPGVEEVLYDSAGCGSLWASIWGGNRCRTRPRCASSAIC
jgi:IS5 family transposase